MPKKPFSPTEKRVYNSISYVGESVHQLSLNVGINIHRLYKYLRRLRNRPLVFTRKKPRIYYLTPSGVRSIDFLEETEKLVLDALKASNYLLQRSRDTVVSYHLQKTTYSTVTFQSNYNHN